MNNKTMGKFGEEIAQNYLKKLKFKILETNFRHSKFSEIDIIAQKDDILHFVEVKTRSSNFFGSPFEAVTKTKLKSIYDCAKYYITQTDKKYNKFQIDVIGIIAGKESQPQIQFLENVSL